MKKILAVLAALMLAITPVLSLAQSAPAITFSTPVVNLAAWMKDLTGVDELTGVDAVQDIMKALAISAYALDDQAGMQFKLDGEVVADVNLKAEATGQDLVLYAGSNLMGENVVKVSMMDIVKTLGLEEQLAQVFGMMQQSAGAVASMDQIDMAALLQLVTIEQGVPAEGEYDCDASAMKITITLPAANFPALVKALGIEGVEAPVLPADLVAVVLVDEKSNPTYIETSLDPVKLTIARKTADAVTYTLKMNAGELEMTGLAAADDKGLVALEFNALIFSLTVNRDAANDNHYTANMNAGTAEGGMSMDWSITKLDNGFDMDVIAYMTAGSEKQEFMQEVISVRASENGLTEDVTVTSPLFPTGINVYMEAGKDGVLLSMADATKTTQYYAFSAVPDTCEVEPLNTADAIDFLNLSAEEMEAFNSEITATATLALLGALSHLPASVMELVMQ